MKKALLYFKTVKNDNITNTNQKYSFAPHEINIFLVENSGKTLIIVILLLYFIAFLFAFDGNLYIKLGVISSLLVLMFLSVNIFIKRFSKKIVFDFDDNKVTFELYRTDKNVTIPFHSMKAKYNPGYVVFYVNGSRYFYNGIISDSLIECLKRSRIIHDQKPEK